MYLASKGTKSRALCIVHTELTFDSHDPSGAEARQPINLNGRNGLRALLVFRARNLKLETLGPAGILLLVCVLSDPRPLRYNTALM